MKDALLIVDVQFVLWRYYANIDGEQNMRFSAEHWSILSIVRFFVISMDTKRDDWFRSRDKKILSVYG